MPIRFRFEVKNQLGQTIFLRPFRFDAWDNLVPIDEATAIHLAVHGVYPPANEVERLLGSARLGTLVLRLRDNIAEIGKAERRLAKGVELTRGYLRQLRDLAAAQETALLVILIPGRHEAGGGSEYYNIATELMEELNLPYMALTNMMNADSDYAQATEGHWNSAGHQKVGALLSDCIRIFIASGNLDECEHVAMP